MDKTLLNVEDLTVESFAVTTEQDTIGFGDDCTGCDSGCGIAGPVYSRHYC